MSNAFLTIKHEKFVPKPDLQRRLDEAAAAAAPRSAIGQVTYSYFDQHTQSMIQRDREAAAKRGAKFVEPAVPVTIVVNSKPINLDMRRVVDAAMQEVEKHIAGTVEKKITYTEVRDKALEVIKLMCSTKKVVGLLAAFGVTNLSELNPEQYAPMYAALSELTWQCEFEAARKSNADKPEALVPLPGGKAIPVHTPGADAARDAGLPPPYKTACMQLIADTVKAGHKAEVIASLKDFDAVKFSQLKPEQYELFHQWLVELAEALKPEKDVYF